MGKNLICRNEFFEVSNSMRLRIRHYAKGYYHIIQEKAKAWVFNRMFFVFNNPDGEVNFIREGEKEIVFEAGNMYFIPGNHPVEMHLNGRVFFISVQFNLEYLPGIDIFSGCSGVYIWKNPWMLPHLDRIFESATDTSTPLASLELNQIVYSAAFQLTGNYPVSSFENATRLRKYIPLINYLERNGNAGTLVTDLAKMAGESRENFSRRFRAETGMTPKQLLMRVITEKSLDFLLTGASVKETAAKLEFSDEFVFSRFFKKQTGLTPTAWKDMSKPAKVGRR